MVFDNRRRSPERRERSASIISGPVSGMVSRPRLEQDVRRASVPAPVEATIARPSIQDQKPVASGNGVSVYISTAEPILYLQGYDTSDPTAHTTTMLRGSLLLRVSKQAKLKSISLAFRGRSETEWPEGIPPKRVDFKDTTQIMNHTWSFFSAQFPQAEHSYSADEVRMSSGTSADAKEPSITTSTLDMFRSSSPTKQLRDPRDNKKLSLQNNQSRSFGKGDTVSGGSSVAQRGFKVFHPGDYIYNFSTLR